MHGKQTEGDWKRFSKSLDLLRNEYLAKQNADLIGILQDQDRDPTAQFWATVKQQKEIQRKLQCCLDGCSRSKLTEKVLFMVQCGMMSQEFLSGFSEEFQESIRRGLQFRNEPSSEDSSISDA